MKRGGYVRGGGGGGGGGVIHRGYYLKGGLYAVVKTLT